MQLCFKTTVMCFLYLWCFILVASDAHAHTTNKSLMVLSLEQDHLIGEWRVPLNMLDRVLDLDLDEDKQISWAEVTEAKTRIEALLTESTRFSSASQNDNTNDETCLIHFEGLLLQNSQSGVDLFLPIKIKCDTPVTQDALPTIHYQLFFNYDPWHRGYIILKGQDSIDSARQIDDIENAYIASPEQFTFVLSGKASSALEQFKQFLIEGVWHIWIGIDHILFLIALLLPAIFVYNKKEGLRALDLPVHSRFIPMFYDILKIVTAFTLSHSVTLGLSAFNVLTLPSVLVEVAIALSVVLSALLIWFPKGQAYRWQIAFVFGFIHGFGFANVLAELTLPAETFALCLFAFNVGVELGQLAIVAGVLPMMYFLRHVTFYRGIFIPACMVLIALTGTFWVIERSLGL